MLLHGAWHWAWGGLVRLCGERSRACCPTGRAGRPGLCVLRGLAQQAGRAGSEGSSVPPMWPQRQALGDRAPPAGPARTARPPCPAPTHRPRDPLALLLSGGGVQTPASRPPVRGRGPPRGGTGRERRRRRTEKEKGPRAEERGTPRGWKRRDSPRNPRRETPPRRTLARFRLPISGTVRDQTCAVVALGHSGHRKRTHSMSPLSLEAPPEL